MPDTASERPSPEPGERLAMIMAQHGMARYADAGTIAQWSDRPDATPDPEDRSD